jgi:hypothetical protein
MEKAGGWYHVTALGNERKRVSQMLNCKIKEDFPLDSKRHGLQRILWAIRIFWERIISPQHAKNA